MSYIRSTLVHSESTVLSNNITEITSNNGVTVSGLNFRNQAILGPVVGMIENRTTQSILTSTTTSVTFNTNVINVNGGGDAANNQLVATEAGVYLVSFYALWSNHATIGTERLLILSKSGSSVAIDSYGSCIGDTGHEVFYTSNVAAGTTFTVSAWQNSGSTLNIGAATPFKYSRGSLIYLSSPP